MAGTKVEMPDLTSLTPWGAIATGAGGIINAVATWYGANEQRKENAKTRASQERMYNDQAAREDRQYAGNMAFQRETAATTVKLTKAQMRQQARAQAAADALAKKQLALSETGQNANIALGNRSATLAETQNAQNFGLSKEAQTANIALGNRGMALQEKQAETEASANKFNQIAQLMTSMTQFYNTPAARQNLAGLYGGYRR